MSILLLSDLHLPATASPLRDRFLAFLAGPARSCSALYILGDLFEYWIGDDMGRETYADECRALSALVAAGVPVYLMHGNRDHLVGKDLCDELGIGLLDDPHLAELDGCRVLLSHGDLWCSDDVGYQRWRRFAHNPMIKALFLKLPRELRMRIAGDVRKRSGDSKSAKAAEIMDVNAEAIRQAFGEYRVDYIIHGHTHRPDVHELEVDGRCCKRVVLADWRAHRMPYLCWTAGSFEMLEA